MRRMRTPSTVETDGSIWRFSINTIASGQNKWLWQSIRSPAMSAEGSLEAESFKLKVDMAAEAREVRAMNCRRWINGGVKAMERRDDGWTGYRFGGPAEGMVLSSAWERWARRNAATSAICCG